MLVKIFFNTDGFIGAWSHHSKWIGKISLITQKDIDQAKKDNTEVVAEMNPNEIQLFGRTCCARNGIEVVTGKEFDAKFGTLKVKLHDEQKIKLVKETKKAHKLNKNLSHLEQLIYI